jgi:hypothetical protein
LPKRLGGLYSRAAAAGLGSDQESLGDALAEQAIRSEDVKAMELLDQAVAAYRGALEVVTREQLPEQWAEVEESLGRALTE